MLSKQLQKKIKKLYQLIPGDDENVYKKKGNLSYKELVRLRDNNTCQLCGFTTDQYNLDVHHHNYLSTDNESWNGITLCRSCHSRIKNKYESSAEWWYYTLGRYIDDAEETIIHFVKILKGFDADNVITDDWSARGRRMEARRGSKVEITHDKV